MKGKCHDYICSNSNTVEEFLKHQSDSVKKEPESEGPLNIITLGRCTWPLLHNMPKKYPKNPTEEDKKKVTKFMNIFAEFYPCIICRADFINDMKRFPIKTDSRENLALWVSIQRNLVKIKLGQKTNYPTAEELLS